MNCKKCTRPVRGNTKIVNCSSCNALFHPSCGKISDSLIKEIEEGTSDWRCPSCRSTDKRKSIVSNNVRQRNASVSSDINDKQEATSVPIDTTIGSNISVTLNNLSASFKMLNAQHQQLTSSFDTISRQLEELQSLSTAVTAHDKKIITLETENKFMKSTIKALSLRLDNVDQKFYNNKLQISRVPYTEGEDLYNITAEIGKNLKIYINKDDILDAHRFRSVNMNNRNSPIPTDGIQPTSSNNENKQSSRDNPIIIQFKSVYVKNSILKSYRNFKNNLYFDIDEKNRIFINDHLSSNRRRLFYKARVFCKSNNYKYVWTNSGNIYIRKNENSKKILINSLTNFASIDDGGMDGAAGMD